MVVGSILGIGGMIVDGMEKAEKERLAAIKTVNIVANTVAVQNLNKIKDFEALALTGSESAGGRSLTKSRSDAANLASTIRTSSITNFATSGSAGQIGTAGDLDTAGQKFALTNRRAFALSGDTEFQNTIQTAIMKVAGGTGTQLSPEQIGSSLGKLTGLTSKNQDSIFKNLASTGIIGKDQIAQFKDLLKFNSKGAVTEGSLSTLLTEIGKFSKGDQADGSAPQTYIPNIAAAAPGLTDLAIKTSNLEYANGEFRNRDVAQGALKPVVTKATTDAVLDAFGGFGLGKGKGIFLNEDASGNVRYKGQAEANSGIAAIKALSTALTGKAGTITGATVTRYVDSQGGAIDAAEYNKLTPQKQKLYTQQSSSGYKVGEQFMTFDQIKEMLRGFKVEEDGKKVDVGEALTVKGLDRLVKGGALAGLTSTGQKGLTPGAAFPLTSIANADSAAQRAAFTNASADVKSAGVEFGKAAAKLDGFSSAITGNTNRAIAYAIVASSDAGKAAIADKNIGKINSLITAELKVLGLPAG
jgi:hypothetical protein